VQGDVVALSHHLISEGSQVLNRHQEARQP
jgi:hypothetical protein